MEMEREVEVNDEKKERREEKRRGEGMREKDTEGEKTQGFYNKRDEEMSKDVKVEKKRKGLFGTVEDMERVSRRQRSRGGRIEKAKEEREERSRKNRGEERKEEIRGLKKR